MKFRGLVILLCWLASSGVNGQELSIAGYNLPGNTLDNDSNYPNGIYVVTVRKQNGETSTKKITNQYLIT